MRILFYDATPGFSIDRKDTKPCGGILTSLTIIPQYLASKGHEVVVKCTISEKQTVNGVEYIPNGLKETMPKWDVIVLNRNGVNHSIVDYSHSIGAKVYWWLHDIVDFRYLEDSAFKKVDKIIALSEYCKNSYSDFYDIPKDKFVVIPNGADTTVFYPGKYEDRKKHHFIMASALIKGTIPVYDAWMDVKRQFPSATMTIYSSQALHEKNNSATQKAWLNEMELAGAKVQQPIPQSILADKMRHAWALLMPNSYPEICSNLLLQAQACGLPVISSNIGSASEFIKHNETGILTEYAPHDLFLWIKKYSEAVVGLSGDDNRHKFISTQSPKVVKNWKDTGEKWNELF